MLGMIYTLKNTNRSPWVGKKKPEICIHDLEIAFSLMIRIHSVHLFHILKKAII